MNSFSGPRDWPTGRYRIPVIRVMRRYDLPAELHRNPLQQELPFWRPLRIELVEIGEPLSEKLISDPAAIYSLSPAQFEELICDRLAAMGFEPRRVGHINQKDGGIDILFWPRFNTSFPFLGAAQVKHHSHSLKREGPATVREFSGVMTNQPFNAGLLVTNTTFTPDAEWYARERAKLIRLRDFTDIRRWLIGNFTDEAEWREIPSSIELCPGVVVKIR